LRPGKSETETGAPFANQRKREDICGGRKKSNGVLSTQGRRPSGSLSSPEAKGGLRGAGESRLPEKNPAGKHRKVHDKAWYKQPCETMGAGRNPWLEKMKRQDRWSWARNRQQT